MELGFTLLIASLQAPTLPKARTQRLIGQRAVKTRPTLYPGLGLSVSKLLQTVWGSVEDTDGILQVPVS